MRFLDVLLTARFVSCGKVAITNKIRQYHHFFAYKDPRHSMMIEHGSSCSIPGSPVVKQLAGGGQSKVVFYKCHKINALDRLLLNRTGHP